MSTRAYEAKGRFFDMLQFQTEQGAFDHIPLCQPPARIGVYYKAPSGNEPGLTYIYGGGIRFDHKDLVADSTPGTMVYETVSLATYIRIMGRMSETQEEVDTIAALVGATIGSLVRTHSDLGEGIRLTGILGGAGDYADTDDETQCILAYQVRASAKLTYGA